MNKFCFFIIVLFCMFTEQVFSIAENLWSQGLSLRQIQNLIKVGKSTLQRWFTTSKREHKYFRDTSNVILEKNEVLNICSKYPYYSIRQLVTIVNESTTKNWSSSTMYRFMTSNNLKYSKVYPIGNGKEQEIIEKRTAFSKQFSNIDITKLLCLDETAIYSTIHYHHAWTPKYTRLHLPYQRVVSNKKTLTVCLANDEILHYDSSSTNMNEQLFLLFLTNTLEKANRKYEYLLMDNVAFHKTKKVQMLLLENGVQPIYTSPYSPDWNPVEMFFSFIKRTKKYIDNRFNIHEQIKTLISSIDKQLYRNWFRHVQSNILSNFHP
jgi:transposase